MKSIDELDCVALTVAVPEHGLVAGDVGTVVFLHEAGAAFEVEFIAHDGRAVALVTLSRDKVRALEGEDLPHARRLNAA